MASGQKASSPRDGALGTQRSAKSVKSKELSISRQLELNDMPDCAQEPGPGHYFGPASKGFSSLGEQAVSLPRTGWENWEKVVVSKAHSETYKARQSPGAAYQVPTTLAKHGAKIGTSLRPDLNLSLGIDPHGSPGPTINLRDEVSKPKSTKSFGQASRFSVERRGTSVGPGQYARKDFALSLDVGRTIGTGRAAWEKVITPGWETVGKCRASPGPGPALSFEVEKDGVTYRGHRVVSMGRAERFPASGYQSASPGPGAYVVPSGLEAQAPPRRLQGTKSFPTFGTAAKKPRFRMVLALNCSKNSGWGYF